jgi:drug/metabolite transporter (DMT)-like permease
MCRTMATQVSPRASGHIDDYALLLLLSTLWGASYTFIKVAVESLPPVTLVAARTTIAAVGLLGVLRWRHIVLPTDLAIWCRFLVQACLNSVIPFTLIAWAEQSVDAGRATVLNASAPIFTLLMAACLAREQGATKRQLMGVSCGMIGIGMIVDMQALAGVGQQLLGELAIVVATPLLCGRSNLRTKLR